MDQISAFAFHGANKKVYALIQPHIFEINGICLTRAKNPRVK